MSQIWVVMQLLYCLLCIITQHALRHGPTYLTIDKSNALFHQPPLQASLDNALEVSEEGPQFTRGNQMNYAALWQEKGEYYLSADRLRELNRQLLKSTQPQGSEQKKNLMDELSVTYFARHHNVIREEYQYEKAIVEDRLKTWSLKRLQKEGVTLLNLNADIEGSLYQDSVLRFHLRDFVPLPFHKFVVGDSVRISNSRITQSSTSDEAFVEGIVIDKRTKFLDIAVRSAEAQSAFFTGGPVYRLDAFVNRVTYDRMIEALQSFLPGKTLSSTLRDLILLSYPNSIMRLSDSPGGLKLALPLMERGDDVPAAESVSGQTKATVASSSVSADDNKYRSINSSTSGSKEDSQFKPLSSVIPGVDEVIGENSDIDTPAVSTEVMTLASSLSQLIAQSSQEQRPKKTFQFVKSSAVASEEGELAGASAGVPRTGPPIRKRSTLPAIFRISRRLQAMSEKFPVQSKRAALFTLEEIRSAITEVTLTCPLNPSQRAAVEAALLRPLSLCQGPPGTGKTRTACLMLAILVHLKDLRCRIGGEGAKGISNTRILASAHSNTATDNLLEGLVGLNVSVVRLGRPVNIRSSLWNHTLDAKMQNLAAYRNLSVTLEQATLKYDALKDRAESMNQDISDDDKRDLRAALTEVQQLKKSIIDNEDKFANEVLMNTDVIVSTCVGAGGSTIKTFLREFPSIEIDTVLIDEAAQCMEAASLIPLSYGCRRLILIGDQNQLPPVVAAPEALENGLGVSLFSRLVAGGLQPQLLTEQYRMHPKIAEFASQQFYDNRLLSRVTAANRPTPAGLAWPNSSVPVLFINMSPSNPISSSVPSSVTVTDTFGAALSDEEALGASLPISGGFEQQSNATQLSFCNSMEAEAVAGVVDQLLADGRRALDSIGVISPYSAQVRVLTDLFKERGWISNGASDELPDSGASVGVQSASEKVFENDKTRRTRIRAILESSDSKKSKNATVEEQTEPAVDSREVLTAASIQKLKADFLRKFEQESALVLRDSLRRDSDIDEDTSVDDGDEILAALAGLDDLPSERGSRVSTPANLQSTGESPGFVRETYKPYRGESRGEELKEELVGLQDRSSAQVDIVGTPSRGDSSDGAQSVVDSSVLEVRSVDGFQGREKDVIVISAVRSNRQGRLGFLKDWRRLNVAITRARSGLIVIGDENTLAHDDNWKAFIDWTKDEGCFVDGDIDPGLLTKHYVQGSSTFKDKFSSNLENKK